MARASIVLVLLALTAISGAVARATPRRLADTLSPCRYFPSGVAGGALIGNCGLSPAWLDKHPPMSPYGQALILGAKMKANCAKHNVSSGTKSAYEACAADTENYCYIGGYPGDYRCMTVSDNAGPLTDYQAPCQDSLYEQYLTCQSTLNSDCKGNCVLREDLEIPRVLKQGRQEVGQGYLQYSYCFPAAINDTLRTSGDLRTFLNPTDLEEFDNLYGTCDFAVQLKRRNGYTKLCSPTGNFSTKLGGLMKGTGSLTFETRRGKEFTIDGIDNRLATKCLLAGCDLNFLPDAPELNLKDIDYYECTPNLNTYYRMGVFDETTDAEQLRAVRICSDPRVRFDGELCEMGFER